MNVKVFLCVCTQQKAELTNSTKEEETAKLTDSDRNVTPASPPQNARQLQENAKLSGSTGRFQNKNHSDARRLKFSPGMSKSANQ